MNEFNITDKHFSKLLISVEESLNTINLKNKDFSDNLIYEYLRMIKEENPEEDIREDKSQ